MSGWDTPSRPTWDPQDGPEDGTQAFPAPDGPGADSPWSQPSGGGWGGTSGSADGTSEYFSPDLGQQRKPGATLSGRGQPGPSWPGAARQESARPDYGRSGEFGEFNGNGNGSGSTGEYGGFGGTGEYPANGGSPGSGRPGNGRPGTGSQDFPRRDAGRADFPGYPGYGGQQDQAEQAPAQADRGDADLAARMDPALQDFFSPTKPDPRYSNGRPSPLAPPPVLPDRDLGAGMPTRADGQPSRADLSRVSDLSRVDFTRADQTHGSPAPGLPGVGQGWSDQGQPPGAGRGDGRGPQRPGRSTGGFANGAGRPAPGARSAQNGSGAGSGSGSGSGGGRRLQDDVLPASRGKRILAIGAVVAVVAAGGAYLLLHHPASSNNAADVPTFSPSTSAAAPSSQGTTAGSKSKSKGKSKTPAKKSGVTSNSASTGGYRLSTPATAAGYPLGTDPHFLATATSTVATIEKSAVGGGAGKVTGSPVSASYTLPAAQTIEFVGYQGTFDPAKVMANLKSYGSAEASYPAGKNGGQLACANTTATSTTPSGAVCVWVTKSTLGFTEFFQASGPEALNTAQAKGAKDTVNLRSSVEKLKS